MPEPACGWGESEGGGISDPNPKSGSRTGPYNRKFSRTKFWVWLFWLFLRAPNQPTLAQGTKHFYKPNQKFVDCSEGQSESRKGGTVVGPFIIESHTVIDSPPESSSRRSHVAVLVAHWACAELDVCNFGHAHATVGAPISLSLSAFVHSFKHCRIRAYIVERVE